MNFVPTGLISNLGQVQVQQVAWPRLPLDVFWEGTAPSQPSKLCSRKKIPHALWESVRKCKIRGGGGLHHQLPDLVVRRQTSPLLIIFLFRIANMFAASRSTFRLASRVRTLPRYEHLLNNRNRDGEDGLGHPRGFSHRNDHSPTHHHKPHFPILLYLTLRSLFPCICISVWLLCRPLTSTLWCWSDMENRPGTWKTRYASTNDDVEHVDMDRWQKKCFNSFSSVHWLNLWSLFLVAFHSAPSCHDVIIWFLVNRCLLVTTNPVCKQPVTFAN